MKRASLIILIVLGLTFQLSAQKSPIKFGSVDKSDLEMTVYEKDSSASAVILCNFGNTYFIYSEQKGFQFMYEEECRVKILSEDGYEWADVSIPILNTINGNEKVLNIKGYTYNLENGKVVKTKLSKNARFTEEVTSTYSRVKFTMPNVKVGSVIEFKYTVVSDFKSRFRDWQFQYDIPVVWSEYNTAIPEFFDYNIVFKGHEALHINETKEVYDNIAIVASNRQASGMLVRGVGNKFEQAKLDFTKKNSRYVMKDVPSFVKESYMTSEDNYIAALEFDLSSIKYPGSARESYSNTWHSMNKLLLEHDKFGRQISGDFLQGGKAFLKEVVENIQSKYSEPGQQMVAAFEFVKNHMKWNDYNEVVVTSTLRKAFMEKSGSSADINLLLVLLLKQLNIDAVPVALSTRGNGIIHPSHPALFQLNYVVVLANLNGNNYLMDATSPFFPVNYLPYKCLNGQGRIIDELRSGWVDLYNKKSNVKMSMCDLKLNSEGVFTGKVQSSFRDYASINKRSEVYKAASVQEYVDEQSNAIDGLTINEHKVQFLEEIDKPMVIEYEIELEGQAASMGDMIYFNPLLLNQMNENPFKLENRKYPVDYGYKLNETYINKIQIPDGYVVEEKPENMAFSLEGNGAKFMYTVTVMGNALQVMSKFSVNKTQFLPEEYQGLKEFYNQVVAKHAEQIVLKKTE